MPLRRRAHREILPNDPTDDNARLLAAVKLQDCQFDAITDASPLIYKTQTSSVEEEVQSKSHQVSPRKPLRRIAASLKLRRCMDALKRYVKEHFKGQLIIVHVHHELEYFEQSPKSSPETPSGEWERKGYSCGVSKLKADSDDGLRSTIKWYFWSPSETVRNCPTLEFVCTHLAPPIVWL